MAEFRSSQNWPNKFRVAISGVFHAFQSQNSFRVHLPCAVLVIVAGCYLQLDRNSMGLLVGCVGAVLVAELFNTSIEFIAKSITLEENRHIQMALDVASGAVLVTSLFAVTIGMLLLLPPFIALIAA